MRRAAHERGRFGSPGVFGGAKPIRGRCRSEPPERSPARASRARPIPIWSQAEFYFRNMSVPARRAAGSRSRSVSPYEVNGSRPLRPLDLPINLNGLAAHDLPMYPIGPRPEGWLREGWPSLSLSQSPRPIRTTEEVVERKWRAAARRAAGIRPRSVSRNTVAMRPSSCGCVDGYPPHHRKDRHSHVSKHRGDANRRSQGCRPIAVPGPPTSHDRSLGPLGILPSRTTSVGGVGHQRALRDGLHTTHPVVAIPISVGAGSDTRPLPRTRPHRWPERRNLIGMAFPYGLS